MNPGAFPCVKAWAGTATGPIGLFLAQAQPSVALQNTVYVCTALSLLLACALTIQTLWKRRRK